MKMIPKNPAAPSDQGFPAGTLCMYEHDGTPLIGAVLSFKKQKYQILNQRGREVELPGFRLHRLPGALPPNLDTTTARSSWLADFGAAALTASLAIDLAEIWSFVVGENSHLSSEKLTQAYYGRVELREHTALRLALMTDRIYFKRHEDTFEPRPTETVEELRRSEESRRRKAELQEEFVTLVAARLRDPAIPLPDPLRSFIRLLEDVAVGAEEIDNNRHREAKDLLNAVSEAVHLDLPGSREQRAFTLLEQIHHFTENSNLAFIRHRPPLEFPPEVEAEGQSITAPATLAAWPDAAIRRDLTALEAITIDDASTRDMDDALSVRQTEAGYELGIHVSDVAAIVPRGSLLDREARLRATSIYCPDETVHMFPDAVAVNRCSLVAGEVRPVLSCLITLDRHFGILRTEIVPALIKVRERLSYDTADERLDRDDPLLSLLFNIASTFEAERLANGAIKVQKHEVIVALDEQGGLRLIEIDENAPSRNLVGEMAVLANSLFAHFAVTHRLPAVFRGQEPPDDDSDPGAGLPAGPAYDYAQRSKLKKSTTSLSPQRHASLALDAYLQATSPIRRYVDLCHQRQFLTFLRHGRPEYSREEMETMLHEVEQPLIRANAISRETRRYWALRYLRQVAAAGRPIAGTVIRTDLKNPLIELDEIHIPVLGRIDSPVQRGDRVSLRITAVDPRTDYLRLEGRREQP